MQLPSGKRTDANPRHQPASSDGDRAPGPLTRLQARRHSFFQYRIVELMQRLRQRSQIRVILFRIIHLSLHYLQLFAAARRQSREHRAQFLPGAGQT